MDVTWYKKMLFLPVFLFFLRNSSKSALCKGSSYRYQDGSDYIYYYYIKNVSIQFLNILHNFFLNNNSKK